MVVVALILIFVFYSLGRTDFEDQAYWWTLAIGLSLCLAVAIVL